jgi:hypothetical protein
MFRCALFRVCVVDEAGVVQYEEKVAAEVDVIVASLRRFSAETGARAYARDASQPAAVQDLFRAIDAELGVPTMVVYNASARVRGPVPRAGRNRADLSADPRPAAQRVDVGDRAAAVDGDFLTAVLRS